MSSFMEKEYYNLTISINKALNPMEAPLKMKHARSAIILTHRTKDAKAFWIIATRQPLMEKRITAWKFCHLVHKVLREGHESTIFHSQIHKKMILEMGKLWGHLKDEMGHCIDAYSKLIVKKVEFHEKNSFFPGSLLIDFKQIEKISGDDINFYFQLCVEILDYLDDIIAVQLAIFDSVNTYRMSSMTPQGQCILAPLITLIQDSNPLYDLSVRIMFKLHDKLTNDILSGHRDRFEKQFFQLKHFYDNVRPLQYFADLIQVPHLPDTAPNFTSEVDFGSYQPPVIVVQPDPEPVMDNLIDTTVEESSPQAYNVDNILNNTVQEKDLKITKLQCELAEIQQNLVFIENKNKTEVKQLCIELTELNSELIVTKEMYKNLLLLKDELEQKLSKTPSLMQKATEETEKAKISEEKFSKLKLMYTQIRDEHIKLLRQHNDSTKLLNKEQVAHAELKSEMDKLKLEIKALEKLNEINIVLSTRNSETEIQLHEMETKFDDLTHKYNDIKNEYSKLDTLKSNEIQKLLERNDFYEKEMEQYNLFKLETSSLKSTLQEAKELLEKKIYENEIIIKKYENEMCIKDCNIVELKSRLEENVTIKNNEIEEMVENTALLKEKLKETELELIDMNYKAQSLEKDLKTMLHSNSNLQDEVSASNKEIRSISKTKRENEENHQNFILSLFNAILETTTYITSKINDDTQQNLEKCLSFTSDMDKILSGLSADYEPYYKDKYSIKGLTKKIMLMCYNFTMLHENCTLISITSTDIEQSQDIFNKLAPLHDYWMEIIALLTNVGEPKDVLHVVNKMRNRISEIADGIKKILNASNKNLHLGILLENELVEMDKAVEEATEKFAEMLSKTRSKNNGIQLEVNEKILDTCTFLMECVKMLIKKSKFLQEEIISIGKGSISEKEFYKRNSQWTEGLLSASKSVAKGANLLVEAANKAINNDSNSNFEIIVAAQEIAACTAQLVIASKVKAPKGSTKLSELTKASRDVSKATGAVVATVKDSNQQLEQSQEIDLTHLNPSQHKTMEIEIRLKILQLEQALQSENYKLLSFRRNHYQNEEN